MTSLPGRWTLGIQGFGRESNRHGGAQKDCRYVSLFSFQRTAGCDPVSAAARRRRRGHHAGRRTKPLEPKRPRRRQRDASAEEGPVAQVVRARA